MSSTTFCHMYKQISAILEVKLCPQANAFPVYKLIFTILEVKLCLKQAAFGHTYKVINQSIKSNQSNQSNQINQSINQINQSNQRRHWARNTVPRMWGGGAVGSCIKGAARSGRGLVHRHGLCPVAQKSLWEALASTVRSIFQADELNWRSFGQHLW